MTTETSNARGEVVAWEARDPDDGTRWVTRHASERDGWMGLGRTIRPLIYGDAPPPAAARGDVLLQTALRNLPQYISKSGLVGPDKHSAMQCFEVIRKALAAEGVQAGEVEQRARELLAAELRADLRPGAAEEAESGKLDHDPAMRAIVAALSQQPEARGVVDEETALDALDAACMGNKRVSWHGYTRADRIEVMRRFLAALTGERNG